MTPGIFLYRSAIKTLSLATKIAAFFNPKARLFLDGRKDIFKKLKVISSAQEKRVWFHCASLGEFEQGRPVIERLKAEFPGIVVLLTFYSPSGYEVRKNYAEAKYVFYLPIDSPENARKFLDYVNPELVFFVKYEFWYFYLQEIKKRNIPAVSISAIFRPEQLFFKPYGSLYKSMLYCFRHIFVQNEESLLLLEEIGIKHVTVSGDTRFDRVAQVASQKKDIPLISTFKEGKRLWVIGSSWKEDMELLIPFINKNQFDFKFVIAPHEISGDSIKTIQLSINSPVEKFSEADDNTIQTFNVLIIDNIGMLSSLYAYADFAYIGGGLGKGLHNVLEAATFGIPVIFGNKNYVKFQEAKDLIRIGGAFPVGNYNELVTTIKNLDNEDIYEKACHTNLDYVQSNKGATDKIISFCKSILINS